MSILFGVCQAEQHVVEERQLIELSHATKRYAEDGTFVLANGRIGMGFQPYHSHLRSCFGSQPAVDVRGNILTLDGRIDNHAELCQLLNLDREEIADSKIVLVAFERWGVDCFSRLIGDWAIALWSHAEQSLYLARDHAGTRTLYFEVTGERVLWSTYLETFFTDRNERELDETYAAYYLSCQPIHDLTPYKGITAVTPAHYLVFHEGFISRKAHWEWVVKDKIRYTTDTEYEDRFLSLFRQSVARRIGPGAPIVAQLSGGMDSTSIVCMSDHIRRSQGSYIDLLDTISYYDNSEPNWNEVPYFALVEAKRGKAGIHIATSFSNRTYETPQPLCGGRQHFPGGDRGTLELDERVNELLGCNGYRVIMSGIGGDELLGGLPTPLPELADLLVSLNLSGFLKQATMWGISTREPITSLLLKTIGFIAKVYQQPCLEPSSLPPWLSPRLRQRFAKLAVHNMARSEVLGISPSAINSGLAWWSILESLPHLFPSIGARHEYRYPYLDRDLANFLLRIPSQQLVRPGRRRALMRNALRDLVPAEVLERKRKAFPSRGLLASLRNAQIQIESMYNDPVTASYGLIVPKEFRKAYNLTITGETSRWTMPLIRALDLEVWLRSTTIHPSKQEAGWSKDFVLPPRAADKFHAGRVAS
jgi:asparagine synthase (glutamine-hydrolysing)